MSNSIRANLKALSPSIPGQAQLVISGWMGQSENVWFSIQRNQDQYYLGEQGVWSPTQIKHTVDNLTVTNDEYSLLVMPELLDPLLMLPDVALRLILSDGHYEAIASLRLSEGLLASNALGEKPQSNETLIVKSATKEMVLDNQAVVSNTEIDIEDDSRKETDNSSQTEITLPNLNHEDCEQRETDSNTLEELNASEEPNDSEERNSSEPLFYIPVSSDEKIVAPEKNKTKDKKRPQVNEQNKEKVKKKNTSGGIGKFILYLLGPVFLFIVVILIALYFLKGPEFLNKMFNDPLAAIKTLNSNEGTVSEVIISSTQSQGSEVCQLGNGSNIDELVFVKNCIQSNPSGAELMKVIEQAKQLKLCKIAQRIYAFKAQAGDKGITFAYAKEYDSQFNEEGGCFAKDDATALYWYEHLLGLDPLHSEANERVKALKAK